MAWKKIAWSQEREQVIYREWGKFCTKKHKLDVADIYYNKSLDLNPNDDSALYYRSQCKRNIAQTEQAFLDANHALGLGPMKQPINIEVCDDVYEMNKFEDAKVRLHNYSRKFTGEKVYAFNNRIDVVEEDFSKSLGDSLGTFILEHRDYLLKAHRKMLASEHVDEGPLWKRLIEENKCDVLSILEKEVEMLSPMEKARRMREFTKFNQIYLGKAWVDVLFLRNLRNDKNLLFNKSQWSSKILELLTKTKYQVTLRFLKMLQCRSPLYYERHRANPKKEQQNIARETFLFRVQYKVHRDTLRMLKKLHTLKDEGNVERLRTYVEEIMGNYVVQKTVRVMPIKFEFINEVYNLLALALIESFLDIPSGLVSVPPERRMTVFLRLKAETDEKAVPFEFGKRATYTDMNEADKSFIKYRAIESRLEKRMYFAKYPIERAYLWHEIAYCNLMSSRLDKACLIATRAIAEADKINSNVWKLLALLVKCKANAMLNKVEEINLILQDGMTIAEDIKDPRIVSFFELAQIINGNAVLAKKKAEEARNKSIANTQSSASLNKV